MATKKFILAEKDIPQAWYNVIADMPNKPMSPLNPATKSPLAVEDLYPIFAEELCKQELNTSDAWIEIPEEVRDMYKIWRPTPLVRALGLEKALDTPAHIYFKNESVSPVGSHKLINLGSSASLMFFKYTFFLDKFKALSNNGLHTSLYCFTISLLGLILISFSSLLLFTLVMVAPLLPNPSSKSFVLSIDS